MEKKNKTTMNEQPTIEDCIKIINNASTAWVADNIHPHVPRRMDDTSSSYLRKMAQWMQVTEIFPPNEEQSLDGFIFERLTQTQYYKEYWETMHDESPSLFPLSLSKGEWDEQFSFWQGSRITE